MKNEGNPNEYALNLAKHLHEVKVKVIENLEKAHIKDKIRYDRKHREVTYENGAKVLFHNPAIGESKLNKLMKRFSGSHIVIRQVSPLLYELDFKATPTKSNIVNVSRLKRFYVRQEMIYYFEQNHKPFISKLNSLDRTLKATKSRLSENKNKPKTYKSVRQSKGNICQKSYYISSSDSGNDTKGVTVEMNELIPEKSISDSNSSNSSQIEPNKFPTTSNRTRFATVSKGEKTCSTNEFICYDLNFFYFSFYVF
jgi:hypothetical protein